MERSWAAQGTPLAREAHSPDSGSLQFLLAMLIAATLPLAAIVAEDAGKTKTTDQKQGQSSAMMGMKCMMGKGQMMSNWKEQDAELDKLVAEMNSASAGKKLDAVGSS